MRIDSDMNNRELYMIKQNSELDRQRQRERERQKGESNDICCQ